MMPPAALGDLAPTDRMSLLRDAERCFANQQSLKVLNAFISGVTSDQVVLRSVQEADSRKTRGLSRTRIF